MNDKYEIIQDVMKKRLRYRRALVIFDRLIVILTVCSLPLLLAYVYLIHREMLLNMLIVPASGFIILTVIRSIINAPRPYEVYGFDPVIPKDTVGKSFPSRHVFSIFIIAMCFFQVDTTIACVMFLMGLILAFLRVFGGVHFIKDVIIGAASAIVYAQILFMILSR